jgi:hypothetical protein
MAIAGKTSIPFGDDPVVDHAQLPANAAPAAAAVASVSPTGFGSTSFGGTNNATATTGGFGSSGFGSSPAAGTGSFGSPQAVSFGSGSTASAAAGPTTVMTAPSSSNAASGAEVLLAPDDKFGKFVNSKWRPLMAFIYMITCTCDFVVFPVLWSVLQAMTHGNVTSQWQPLTLQGAGLYHLAMGAVLGVAAYGRTKEKVAGAA